MTSPPQSQALLALIERQCPVCGKTFSRRPNEYPVRFKKRKTCSYSCGSRLCNARNHTETVEQMLARRSAPDGTGCIVWNGPLNKYGYGTCTRDGKKARAHRLAFEDSVGPVPPGMCVCHLCDNRACINPNHLFLGDNAANTADRNAKGRQAKGERQGRTKLSEDMVRAIRASTVPHTELAARYGVGATVISNVRKRKTWRHVP